MAADIRGTYAMHDGLSNVGLLIRNVDSSGTLVDSFMRDGDFNIVPIAGTFDGTYVRFWAGLFPEGNTVFATYYDGIVVLQASAFNGVFGIAGAWNRLAFHTVHRVPRIVPEKGTFFADQHGPEIY